MGAQQRVVVAPFIPFLLPYHVESNIEILVLDLGQDVSSIEYDVIALYTILDLNLKVKQEYRLY